MSYTSANILRVGEIDILHPTIAKPDSMSKIGLTDENLSRFIYSTTRPEGHPDAMTEKAAAEAVGIKASTLRARCAKALRELYKMVFITPPKIDEMGRLSPVAAQRVADSTVKTRRRRSKKEIEAEHKSHDLRKKIRMALNLPLRGRLNTEQQSRFDAEFAKRGGKKLMKVQRVSDATTATRNKGRGRPHGVKNRSKEEIEDEKYEREIRAQARRDLGLPKRGRLTDKQKEQFEAKVANLRK